MAYAWKVTVKSPWKKYAKGLSVFLFRLLPQVVANQQVKRFSMLLKIN